MTIQTRFDAISPLDYRFYGGDDRLYRELHPYLSEDAAVRYKARVEGVLAQAMAKAGIVEQKAADAIAAAAAQVDPAAVAEEEKATRHDVRALVNVIRAKLPEETRRFVHLGATSYDIVDTANALRYREATEKVVVPRLARAVAKCIEMAEAEADTPQIGRTHGRHAEPITFGFAMAEYVARLGERTLALQGAAHRLPGKLSGAVGAYNAMGLLTAEPRELEKRFLRLLKLRPAPVSTQIVPPEGWTDLAHGAITALGVLANLADDMRHLQRSEISEIAEAFAAEQVGSSTMPHKRNPVSFENVKSLWKAMAPRIVTTYMDQISEHQRDLTNSASQRFLGEILATVAYAAGRTAGSLEGVRVDRERLRANLAGARSGVVAEPLYVLLAKYGHPDAHEAVRRLTLEAERTGRPVLEIARLDPDLRTALAKLSADERRFLDHPEEYRGLAAQVARDVAAEWREKMAGVGTE
ncbi:MAG TPA: lyase family protein [Candidatus Limnocylindria bacterium]|nr:lyase family protein [Candidatus Limnocylindria bacterium]